MLKDGCKLSDDCFTMCVVLILTNLVGRVPFNVLKKKKSATNMFDSLVVTAKQNYFTPFSHITTLGYERYVTYGIRARVEMLGPIGLKMILHVSF